MTTSRKTMFNEQTFKGSRYLEKNIVRALNDKLMHMLPCDGTVSSKSMRNLL